MTTTAHADQENSSVQTRVIHWLISLLVSVLFRLSQFARFFSGYRVVDTVRGADVLLTGTFQSEAWIMAYINPLAMAESSRTIVLVTTFPVPDSQDFVVIHPPSVLCRIIGEVPARLLTFAWHAIRRRPALIGGFHISINALVADLVASLSGARSMYVCVGGPIEVIDGGLWGESRIFGKLRHADAIVESKLLRSVRRFDAIVTMGGKANAYFEENGVRPDRLSTINGGIDAKRFQHLSGDRQVDAVFVGRLVPIKCVDLLLRAIRIIVDQRKGFRARIIGDGPLKGDLEQLARELDIESNVVFVGFLPDVVDELGDAKCFVLTSESEGLSFALIEAMLAGSVPVVADVGDLSDLVEDEVNGRLVSSP